MTGMFRKRWWKENQARRDAVLDLFFPSFCPLCRRSVQHPHSLCSPCLAALPDFPDNYCLRCGGDTEIPQWHCRTCTDRLDCPDRVYFPFVYEEGIRKLIVGYKFYDRSQWSTLLARLCWHRMAAELIWEEPDMVVPIPLHFWRFLARRYNQSALLGKALAEKMDRPLVTNGLKRIKMTQPQSRLSSQGRRSNVRGAFRADEKKFVGRSLLLVDDVFTTGATVSAAITELRRVGAKRVAVLCVARAAPR